MSWWTRLSGAALVLVYFDAALRVLGKAFGGGSPSAPMVRAAVPTPQLDGLRTAQPGALAAAVAIQNPVLPPSPAIVAELPQQQADAAEQKSDDAGRDGDACAKHDVLYGNLFADLAPWIDQGLRIHERQMRDVINTVGKHRGKWDSWVTDTLTPILIVDGNIYLTLGPPTKDPTNYFWTVLQDLQQLARKVRLPDVELLLNFADTPVVFAPEHGRPTPPGMPVFSYCKQERFLDVLVPGYYTPDRVCHEYRRQANARHPWRSKTRRAFARYTHFCKRRQQKDEFGRPLPPCARSYYASLAATPTGQSRLDVKPLNVVNDTSDPSLAFGQRLLTKGLPLPMADHGAYAYLLDTDGFTSAYKLQQLLATNSLVLHHRSPWRAFYYRALQAYVHYVPLWRSSSDDVLRVVDWLGAHDRLAERVAAAGQRFACEHLTLPARLCYWRKAIDEYAASFLAYAPTLDTRPRAFPLDRLNIMCRVRDGPNVCYYNIKAKGLAIPAGYRCEKPVPGQNGSFEECWYRAAGAAAV